MDLDVYGRGEKEMTARDFLYTNLETEDKNYFGNKNLTYLSQVCDAWMNDEVNSAHRYDEMKRIVGEKVEVFKILDMASGCGSFVFYGLMHGYDVYGVEPEEWKHQFNSLKSREKGYPDIWMKRFCYGVGESLPYENESFDVISTYQTLEHVQSHERCFSEFRRVLKKGGYLFIKCPDYTSFFEGHYNIPMLPLMNRSLFKFYLNVLKRPAEGLDSINYVSRRRVKDLLGDKYHVEDINHEQIRKKIHQRTKINSSALTHVYSIFSKAKTVFRSEDNVNIVAIKK